MYLNANSEAWELYYKKQNEWTKNMLNAGYGRFVKKSDIKNVSSQHPDFDPIFKRFTNTFD